MFDPATHNAPKTRKLPVVLLLDVSGSMANEKIEKLYDSVVDMIDCFIDEGKNETEIDVAIFTFGNTIELHTPYTLVKDLKAKGINRFTAFGNTPLGACLTMAKEYIEDKENTSNSVYYTPSVVLVSDGAPNDEWEQPLADFIGTGRTGRSQRLAIAIGSDADKAMLAQFTGNDNLVFYAEGAGDIAKSFKMVTMSVSTRSRSKTSNAVSANGASVDNISTGVSVSRVSVKSKSTRTGSDEDDDLDI